MSITSINRNDRAAHHTVVIGLGNTLMGDDGLGVAAVARLSDEWILPPNVELVFGDNWGLALLPAIEDAGRVLLVDAIDAGVAPGSDVRIERNALPRYFSTKLSPHQVDLREVLALAEIRGRLPAEIVAIGLQPACISWAQGLSEVVADGLDRLVGCVIDQLRRWGHVGFTSYSATPALVHSDCTAYDGLPKPR